MHISSQNLLKSSMHCTAGNTNTLAGNVPPKADLGDLRGLASGIDGRIAPMINGGDFDGAKAYKDSKVGLPSAPFLSCSCAWTVAAHKTEIMAHDNQQF